MRYIYRASLHCRNLKRPESRKSTAVDPNRCGKYICAAVPGNPLSLLSTGDLLWRDRLHYASVRGHAQRRHDLSGLSASRRHWRKSPAAILNVRRAVARILGLLYSAMGRAGADAADYAGKRNKGNNAHMTEETDSTAPIKRRAATTTVQRPKPVFRTFGVRFT